MLYELSATLPFRPVLSYWLNYYIERLGKSLTLFRYTFTIMCLRLDGCSCCCDNNYLIIASFLWHKVRTKQWMCHIMCTFCCWLINMNYKTNRNCCFDLVIGIRYLMVLARAIQAWPYINRLGWYQDGNQNNSLI